MDQAKLLALLAEYSDDLTPEAERLEEVYRSARCPQCAGRCQKFFDSRHAFSDPNVAVPRALLRCTDCGCEFDPHSGLRLKQGNLGKIPVPHVIVRPKE